MVHTLKGQIFDVVEVTNLLLVSKIPWWLVWALMVFAFWRCNRTWIFFTSASAFGRGWRLTDPWGACGGSCTPGSSLMVLVLVACLADGEGHTHCRWSARHEPHVVPANEIFDLQKGLSSYCFLKFSAHLHIKDKEELFQFEVERQ